MKNVTLSPVSHHSGRARIRARVGDVRTNALKDRYVRMVRVSLIQQKHVLMIKIVLLVSYVSMVNVLWMMVVVVMVMVGHVLHVRRWTVLWRPPVIVD